MKEPTAKPIKTSVTPATEADILAVTIGTPELLNSTVYLAEYDPDWPVIFMQLAQEIRGVLGDSAGLLEHVGSTSVPGLAAKPIIDMVLAVAASADESAYVPQLETLGYKLTIREPDWYEHRVFKLPEPKVNLHVFSAGCKEIGRRLAFRDWLRHHPDDKTLYETTKRELSQQTWKYIQNYADAKSAVVQEIMGRADGKH
ncbi:cyclopropane fatty acid synthase methyltransferase [Leptolyngbya sp. Heron Island J]|uniref:GrpB family protein n=1 Tax=Leptolyngbya sp. Heron Island J TaxID=1385935 RepID=UPI0003B962B6|nr:GrpB family protein [Leptolyngbya sp. Heron Island J]ESA38858.1 cyclopropane fatty acid synthase methyltransferase [Leptolyngbya sp. Heron Island J]